MSDSLTLVSLAPTSAVTEIEEIKPGWNKCVDRLTFFALLVDLVRMETSLATEPLDQDVYQIQGVSDVRADHLNDSVHLRFANQCQFFFKIFLALQNAIC